MEPVQAGDSGRYYRPELPVPTSGTSAAALLVFSGSSTGSSTGTTDIPELPVLFPVLPALRVFSSNRWHAFLGGPEVPPLGPVLPVLRIFFSEESRWGYLTWDGSTAHWAGTSAPAGI